jgi:hypothetical protein
LSDNEVDDIKPFVKDFVVNISLIEDGSEDVLLSSSIYIEFNSILKSGQISSKRSFLKAL